MLDSLDLNAPERDLNMPELDLLKQDIDSTERDLDSLELEVTTARRGRGQSLSLPVLPGRQSFLALPPTEFFFE